MSAWSPTELDTFGAPGEIAIAPRRRDGALPSYTTVWVVRVDGDLYLRSYNGPSGSWFRGAQRSGSGRIRVAQAERDVTLQPAGKARDEIDAAYRAKYGRSPYVDAMVSDAAAATTLQLCPER